MLTASEDPNMLGQIDHSVILANSFNPFSFLLLLLPFNEKFHLLVQEFVIIQKNLARFRARDTCRVQL